MGVSACEEGGEEGCISVLVGARGVRGWILYLYGNVWGGVGRVIVFMHLCWRCMEWGGRSCK